MAGSLMEDERAPASARVPVFNVSCTTSKHPSQVAREVLRACAALKIACRQTGFLFQAQRGNMTFNVELTGLDMGLHLVRVRRTAGEVDRAVLMTR